MSSLAKRSAVLAIAKTLNRALQIVSPIILVRLLDVNTFGEYRQFTITSMFLAVLCEFAISVSITYFLAREPDKEAQVVTNSCFFLALTSALAAMLVMLLSVYLVPPEIRAHAPLLAAYVMLFLNFDIAVAYWLAKKRSDLILLYSSGVMLARVGTTAAAAALFADTGMIIISMVATEAIKCLSLYVWLRKRKLLVYHWDWSSLREQLRFVAPNGGGHVLYGLNNDIGRLIVSGSMGAAPLAVYAIASYQIPVVSILRSAITDATFSDMVNRAQSDRLNGLRLWKRTNTFYTMILLPTWALLTWFAEPLIRLLFTEAYVSATPYFQVLLLIMLRQSFDFSSLLRMVGVTKPFMTANLTGLIVNISVTLMLMPKYGLWGPALGTVAMGLWMLVMLSKAALSAYDVSLAELLDWSKLKVLAAGVSLGTAGMAAVQWWAGDTLLGYLLQSLVFSVIYATILTFSNLEEFDQAKRLATKVLRRFPGFR